MARATALLSAIHLAQLEHVLESEVLAMDESPIKAGHKSKGKMKAAWFWPLYGAHDEMHWWLAGRDQIRCFIDEAWSLTPGSWTPDAQLAVVDAQRLEQHEGRVVHGGLNVQDPDNATTHVIATTAIPAFLPIETGA